MMGVQDLGRIRALLGGDEWRWLRQRLRVELEAGRPIPRSLVRREPTQAEREAANRLFAKPGVVGPVRVSTEELTLILRDAAIADDLAACMVALDGPLLDRAALRHENEASWNAVNSEAVGALMPFCPESALKELLVGGFLRRVSANQPSDARAFVRQAAAVLATLHSRSEWLLAELAAAATGDAHALDRDMALGRLVLRLLTGGHEDGVLAWRTAWATAGVVVDAVSASTLTLNLPVIGVSRLARVCESMVGEPIRLTARQIDRKENDFAVQGRTIFVCENPTIVAAAANALRGDCPPMICIDGWATTPSLLLLRRLEQDGARLKYQGDGDWAGISIAAELRRHVAVTPWRLTSEQLPLLADRPGPPLIGQCVETPWDTPLSKILSQRGRALHEEVMLDVLIEDLRAARHN